MHSVLAVDEIVREIFACPDLDLPSLCRAARTCKAWKDPALDVVWRFLPSVKPILDLVNSENDTTVRLVAKFYSISYR